MNFDNFTIKSQEAIQKAVEIVRNHNEQSIAVSYTHLTLPTILLV